ncbi:MAG: carbon-phosphorus lyase complex subunit PhnI, partial [Actinomycetota bacterium]
ARTGPTVSARTPEEPDATTSADPNGHRAAREGADPSTESTRHPNGHRAAREDAGPSTARVPGRLMDVLRSMDVLVDRRRDDDPPPADITRVPARPGAPRSARLSAMARAETGALVQLWYRNILGPDRNLHEVTLGEVRHGRLPIRMQHPDLEEPVTVGHVRATEVEAIEDLDGSDEDRTRFDVGYGMCLGHNERKAIAMANLDIAVHRNTIGNTDDGVLEQSILMTTDGLDASGFLEHLKLPHYVMFRSMMERKQTIRTDRAANQRRGRLDRAADATTDSEPS